MNKLSSGFIQIKDILNEITSPRISSKGTHYEFQDFAYRLALDLNDLDRLGIYMRLVKNNPRSLLQEAYQFVIDSKIKNKAKMFMWKFKKLKLEFENKKNENNFDYKYVSKQILELRKLFSQKILNFNQDENIENYHKYLAHFNINDKGKILVLNIENLKLIPKKLKNSSVSILENCKPFYDLLCLNFDKKKIFKSDFFSKSFKQKFDYIFIGNFWNYFPHELNLDFLNKILLISKKGSIFIFNITFSDESSQKWIFSKNSNFPIFSKKTNSDKLNDLFKQVGIVIIDNIKLSEKENIIISQKI